MARIPVGRLKLLLATVALLVLAVGVDASGNAPWVQMGPYGGWVDSLAVRQEAPAAGYVVLPARVPGERGTLHRTTDGGQSWREVPVDEACDPSAVAVTAGGDELLYVGCVGAIYRSTDGGVHWSRLPLATAFGVWQLAIAPGDPSLIVAVSDGLYVSRDGGENWEHPRQDRIDGLAISGSGPSLRILAGTEQGLLFSDDMGRTWTLGAPGLPTGEWRRAVGALAAGGVNRDRVYAATSEGVFASRDGGATWKRAGDPPVDDRGIMRTIVAMDVDPQDGEHVYATVVSGVFESMDGGSHWSQVGQGSPGWQQHVVALNGAEGGLLTAGDGVYRWSGRDGSWKRSVSGIARASLSSATVEPGEPWRLLAVSWETGLELSSDGGATWTPAGAGGTVSSWGRLIWDPVTPHVVYNIAGKIWRSDDSGATWSLVGESPPVSLGDAAVAPTSPRTFWLCDLFPYGGLWRSNDGAVTWKRVLNGGEHGGAESVAVAPEEPTTVYASLHDGRIARSFDGGESWELLTGSPVAPFRELYVDTVDPLIGWGVTGGGQVAVTSDGWETWTFQGAGLEGASVRQLILDRANSLHMLAVAEHGAFETSSGGAAWRRLGDGIEWQVERGAWDPVSGTVFLLPFARSILAGTFGNEPLEVGIQAERLPEAGAFRFTARISGGVVPYELTWTFGDGTGVTAGNPVLHRFRRPGRFNVGVSVADHLGARSDARRTVHVPAIRRTPSRPGSRGRPLASRR